jgi:hypothetical protein
MPVDRGVFSVGKSFSTDLGVNMYIDPNTGGILFQALAGLLAVVSGVLFFFSRQIRSGIARLRRGRQKDEEDHPQS